MSEMNDYEKAVLLGSVTTDEAGNAAAWHAVGKLLVFADSVYQSFYTTTVLPALIVSMETNVVKRFTLHRRNSITN